MFMSDKKLTCVAPEKNTAHQCGCYTVCTALMLCLQWRKFGLKSGGSSEISDLLYLQSGGSVLPLQKVGGGGPLVLSP